MNPLLKAVKLTRYRWAMLAMLHAGAVLAVQFNMGQPELPAVGRATYLEYLNAPPASRPLDVPPRLWLSLGASHVQAVLDTGSTGVVVSASRLPIVPEQRRPGQVTYTSSGRIMSGFWVHVPVTLAGRNNVSVTTAPQPVLAVTRISCVRNARHCTPREMPADIAMVGIGFARHDNARAVGEGDSNPLLNLPSELFAGARRGYVISREGVIFGLTQSVASGFSYVRLQPDQEGSGSWQAAPMSLQVERRPDALWGTLLVDTGVTAMFLSAPELGPVARLPAGTQLTVRFAAGASRTATQYSVFVEDTVSVMSPAQVIVSRPHEQAFVNTGVRFLNGFDVLYDADDGYAGYRPHPFGPARPGEVEDDYRPTRFPSGPF